MKLFSLSYLYVVLLDKYVNALEVPILVACNKSEMETAVSSETIRGQLQKELFVFFWSQIIFDELNEINLHL